MSLIRFANDFLSLFPREALLGFEFELDQLAVLFVWIHRFTPLSGPLSLFIESYKQG